VLKINDICNGNWEFLPCYSPDLNPIELGFLQIKRYLRRREASVTAYPIAEIEAAFQRYSTNGDRSHWAWGNFTQYRNRYDTLRDEIV
jgi:transposase